MKNRKTIDLYIKAILNKLWVILAILFQLDFGRGLLNSFSFRISHIYFFFVFHISRRIFSSPNDRNKFIFINHSKTFHDRKLRRLIKIERIMKVNFERVENYRNLFLELDKKNTKYVVVVIHFRSIIFFLNLALKNKHS